MDRDERVDGAFCQDVHLFDLVTVLKNDLALFKELLLQLVHQHFKRVRVQHLKVHNVEKLTLEPLLVFVLVLDQVVSQFLLDVKSEFVTCQTQL